MKKQKTKEKETFLALVDCVNANVCRIHVLCVCANLRFEVPLGSWTMSTSDFFAKLHFSALQSPHTPTHTHTHPAVLLI